MYTKPTSTPVPDVVVAHNLLGRMLASAQRAGDVGREFLFSGLRRLIGNEIEKRKAAAGAARKIGDEIHSAEQLVADSLADDGVIDAREASLIRSALRKPERHAGDLAGRLAVGEVAS